MRIPLISRFKRTPLDGIEVHTKKIKECTWAFQQALECHQSKKCESFDEHRQDVIRMVNEASTLASQIRSQVADQKGPVFRRFLLLSLLKEQSKIVDSIQSALEWMSFRSGALVPQSLEKDFFLLFDSVIDPIEELVKLVPEVRKMINHRSAKQRKTVLKIISTISNMEQEANRMEERLKRKIFSALDDPAALFHLVRLTEIIASISDQADGAGDLMRAMLNP